MSTDRPTPPSTCSPWAPPDASGDRPQAPQPAYAPAPYQQGYSKSGFPVAPPPPYPAPAGYPYGAAPGHGPGDGPAGYPQPPRYDGLSIAGFVLSLCSVAVLAMIFAIIGLSRTAGGRAKGRGLAIAAIVISSLWIVATVGVLVHAAVNPPAEYTVGTCVQVDDGTGGTEVVDGDVPVVPCAEPHNGEVYATRELPDGAYPGDLTIEQDTELYCSDRFEDFVGLPYESSRLGIFYTYPERRAWTLGDHEVVCIVLDVEDVTATMRDSAR
ncbi:DUF4190 domain-containing protein [Cellulomonas palmilytica]|uniref:DUF4190 domain-containing protein n=1 Tax=Cellulomonas palmilytica TaxID=2608402 RepID=UPI001F2A33A9|nr:DUF4190 domain-containing protein [Cellulomonas palmilytica]UJP40590.1 septum formation family protein [Cellulomonas palmilytica]